MEPEEMNVEKIVGEKVEEACVMDSEDLAVSPSLMLSFKPAELSMDIAEDNSEKSLSEDSPRTPKDAMFDPFAPGPETLLMAPLFRKCRTTTLMFQLSLNGDWTEQCESEDERISAENMLVKDAYDNLLEAILAQEISVSDDPCMTPTSRNLVHDDDAQKCPDAPARTTENVNNTAKVSSKKKLDFDTAGLCRKLEF